MSILSEAIILELGFLPLQDSIFEDMSLRYYVRNGLCLFTNEQEHNNSVKVGYAEMRNGKYHLSTFGWIYTVESLKEYMNLLI